MTANDTSPKLMYGTAWKEDDTERLVRLALAAGFRRIDTANQRKHYHEAAVGTAVAAAVAAKEVRREDLFLQTKFTSLDGQDQRLPYDKEAPPEKQVEQSFAKSLEHLQVRHIDSYVLHGLSQRTGLSTHDWAVWRAMERLYDDKRVGVLGVSNVSLEQIQTLVDQSKVKPRFVQNRCYARAGWDRDVRKFCHRHSIVYQGFSLLTANQREIASQPFQQLATRLACTPAQIVFRFAVAVGMLPLTGTSDEKHMREDLAALGAVLPGEAVELVENIARA